MYTKRVLILLISIPINMQPMQAILGRTVNVGKGLTNPVIVPTLVRASEPIKPITFSDLVVRNPRAALCLMDACEISFQQSLVRNHFNITDPNLDLKFAINHYNTVSPFYAKNCPVFHLGECSAQDCILSRAYNPDYRKRYEQLIVNKLLTKKKGVVTYTSFGAGAKFQDLVILTKYLLCKPDAKVDIHLIDIKHLFFVAGRMLMEEKQEVKEDTSEKLEPIAHQMVYIMKQAESVPDNVTDADIRKTIQWIYMMKEKEGMQFIHWLKNTFPKAHLQLYMHDGALDFVEYIEKNKMSYPDMLTTVDIEDGMSRKNKGPQNYLQLCVKTLQKNPLSSNIWLSKYNKKLKMDGKAHLLSMALQPSHNAYACNFKEKDNAVGTKIYITDSM